MIRVVKDLRNGDSRANVLMECIVALSILQMFLAATIPSLKVFQMPVELLLGGLLVYKVCTARMLVEHVLLIVVFVFVTLCSFFTQGLDTFLVNTKQNGLGVLSLICFSLIKFNSRLIFPIFVITSLLLLANRVVPELMLPFISLTFDVVYNTSTFGGIFLNAHFNSFFLAIALIYYGQQRFLYGGGLVLLNIAGSKFIFASYVANLFYSWVLRRNIVSRKYYIQWAVPAGISLVLCIGIYWADELMEWLVEWNSSIGETNNSVVVIVLQLTDPAYYAALLNPLPSGTIDFYSSAKAPYLEHDGHNEIGFFSLATHSGIFLGLLYLIILLKNAKYYLAFILFSLLHNNFILSPLGVYMLVTYSSFIATKEIKK